MNRIHGKNRLLAGIVVGSVAVAFAACSGSSSSDGGDDSSVVTDAAPDTTTAVESGVDASRSEPSTKLAINYVSSCALVSGSVRCWGNNPEGQLGFTPVDNNPHPTPTSVGGIAFTPTAVGLGDYHACASDGTQMSCWGETAYGNIGEFPSADAGCVDDLYSTLDICPPFTSQTFRSFESLALGQYLTCAVLADKTVSCIGYGGYGELGASSDGGWTSAATPIVGLTNVAEVGVGEQHACARMNDGTVACWGTNNFGQLGQKTSPGVGFDTTPHPNPLTVPGVNAVQLSVGPSDTCVTSADATVTCWGYNASDENPKLGGQLGHDPVSDSLCSGSQPCDPTPAQVAGLTNVREVSAGYLFTCAVKNDDTVVCWGANNAGELETAASLGDGGLPYNFTPQPMAGLTNVAHVFAGYDHACAITWDDHVLCWGDNDYGQIGAPVVDGGPTFSATPITPSGF